MKLKNQNLWTKTSVTAIEVYHAYLTSSITMNATSRGTPEPEKYDATEFLGILIDTGCSNASRVRMAHQVEL